MQNIQPNEDFMSLAKSTIFLRKTKRTWSRYLAHWVKTNSNKHWENKLDKTNVNQKTTDWRVWEISQLIENVALSQVNKILETQRYLCWICLNKL